MSTSDSVRDSDLESQTEQRHCYNGLMTCANNVRTMGGMAFYELLSYTLYVTSLGYWSKFLFFEPLSLGASFC